MLAVIIASNGLDRVRMTCCHQMEMMGGEHCRGDKSHQTSTNHCCDGVACDQCFGIGMLPVDLGVEQVQPLAAQGVGSSCTHVTMQPVQTPQRPPQFI